MHQRKYIVDVSVVFKNKKEKKLSIQLTDCPDEIDNLWMTLLKEIERQYKCPSPVAFIYMLRWKIAECECSCHHGGWDGGGTCKQPCDECDGPDGCGSNH